MLASSGLGVGPSIRGSCEDAVVPSDTTPASDTDVLGEPYLAETLDLPPDDEGEVVATLVRRAAGRAATAAP